MDEIELTIDRIVITGQAIPAAQTGQFQALLETELGRILEQRYGLAGAPVWRSMMQLELPPIDLDDPGNTQDLIVALARRIAQSLGAPNAGM